MKEYGYRTEEQDFLRTCENPESVERMRVPGAWLEHVRFYSTSRGEWILAAVEGRGIGSVYRVYAGNEAEIAAAWERLKAGLPVRTVAAYEPEACVHGIERRWRI